MQCPLPLLYVQSLRIFYLNLFHVESESWRKGGPLAALGLGKVIYPQGLVPAPSHRTTEVLPPLSHSQRVAAPECCFQRKCGGGGAGAEPHTGNRGKDASRERLRVRGCHRTTEIRALPAWPGLFSDVPRRRQAMVLAGWGVTTCS